MRQFFNVGIVGFGEAEGLTGRAESAGRLLSVFHNCGWDADLLTKKRILASGGGSCSRWPGENIRTQKTGRLAVSGR